MIKDNEDHYDTTVKAGKNVSLLEPLYKSIVPFHALFMESGEFIILNSNTL